jgi:hypothetical protein
VSPASSTTAVHLRPKVQRLNLPPPPDNDTHDSIDDHINNSFRPHGTLDVVIPCVSPGVTLTDIDEVDEESIKVVSIPSDKTGQLQQYPLTTVKSKISSSELTPLTQVTFAPSAKDPVVRSGILRPTDRQQQRQLSPTSPINVITTPTSGKRIWLHALSLSCLPLLLYFVL